MGVGDTVSDITAFPTTPTRWEVPPTVAFEVVWGSKTPHLGEHQREIGLMLVKKTLC